jgi:hypothetical protein
MILNDIEIDSYIELLKPQCHENIAVIPLKTERKYIDLLTLKKGLELGLAEVKECKSSTVNTLVVKNNSVTPLILIDGEEIVGGDQNRIMNETVIVAPNSESKISVSCTEKGRWAYKNEFKSSMHLADYNTRFAKGLASRRNKPVQREVWSSIDALERRNDFHSPTGAMSESYDNLKDKLDGMLESFEIVDGQTGVLVMVNGEIKGFEVFLSHDIYRDFHEKVLKSYLIDSKVEDTTFTVNVDEARMVIESAFDSAFEKRETAGLETAYEFENPDGLGKAYIFENEIVHLSYFYKIEDEKNADDVFAADDINYAIRD